ncbi:MAG: hypothetical protein U0P30_06785 [Vicinamibacterales bacterium]
MATAGHRFELILSVANLDAAAWLWTVVAREAPAMLERDGRREAHVSAGHVRLRLRQAAADAVASVSSLDLAVDPESMPDVLLAAAQAGYATRALDDASGYIVTVAPGVEVTLHTQAPQPLLAVTPLPAGRLVRRPPRAEAPRAKRPERKKPEAGRGAPESSAKAPRRIVRPRGQVRKVGKK